MARGRKRYKRERGDVVLSFKVGIKTKKRLEEIAHSFDGGIANVFTGDIAETIILAFFKGNIPPKDMEVARELIIKRKKEQW